MKNLLIEWELRKKINLKLKLWGLLLLGFLIKSVKWPLALLSDTAGPGCWRLNY